MRERVSEGEEQREEERGEGREQRVFNQRDQRGRRRVGDKVGEEDCGSEEERKEPEKLGDTDCGVVQSSVTASSFAPHLSLGLIGENRPFCGLLSFSAPHCTLKCFHPCSIDS